MLAEVFGLEISQGAIDNILQRTAQRLEPQASEIHQTVQSSRVVGSDETGVRVDGVFQTPQASYYVIDQSRSTQVIRDVMEEAMPEVCSQGSPTPKAYGVSDLFSAQLSSPAIELRITNHELRITNHELRNGLLIRKS